MIFENYTKLFYATKSCTEVMIFNYYFFENYRTGKL